MASTSLQAFQNNATVTTLKIIEWSMRFLPRWFVVGIVEVFSAIAFLFIKRLKKICRRNLRLVYKDSKSEEEYDRLVKRCIKNIGYAMMDILYYIDRPKKLSKVVHVKNEQYLKEALESGRGVVAVSAHLSNFPLMFLILSRKGYKINVVIRKMRDNGFSRFMYALCAKWDIHMIQTAPTKPFVRESLGALKRNELLFILFDEIAEKKEGIEVDFFNRPTYRAPGPMLFHSRTQSPIVPIFMTQDKDKHFHICIEPPLEVHSSSSVGENNIKNISALNRTIERYIYECPFLWGGWLNKKWV